MEKTENYSKYVGFVARLEKITDISDSSSQEVHFTWPKDAFLRKVSTKIENEMPDSLYETCLQS